jgi:iron complex outermembrane receptor protein
MSLTLAMLLAGQTVPQPTPEPVPTPESAPIQDDASAAQGAPAPAGAGDIVVTARRRAESVQRVPIAISVIGGAELDKTGAFNVNRLQQQQPSLQFYSSNPRNSAINIRGLGAPFGLTNDGIEQGVGFYVDGVYIGRIGASTFDFVDVERVEVLRGPQGTLYGKNTTSGALNITTRPPSFTPEARIELTAGSYQFVQAKASVSGPLSDTVALRLSASSTQRQGTIYDVTSGRNLHRLDNNGVRGQLLWNASDSLNFTLSGDYNVQNPLCCVQYYARVGTTQRPIARQYAALAAAFNYRPPSTNPFDRVTDLDAPINSRQEIGGVSLVGNWDLGPIAISSDCRSRRCRRTRRSRNRCRRSCVWRPMAPTGWTIRSARSSFTRRSIRRGRRCRDPQRAGSCCRATTRTIPMCSTA